MSHSSLSKVAAAVEIQRIWRGHRVRYRVYDVYFLYSTHNKLNVYVTHTYVHMVGIGFVLLLGSLSTVQWCHHI